MLETKYNVTEFEMRRKRALLIDGSWGQSLVPKCQLQQYQFEIKVNNFNQ